MKKKSSRRTFEISWWRSTILCHCRAGMTHACFFFFFFHVEEKVHAEAKPQDRLTEFPYAPYDRFHRLFI